MKCSEAGPDKKRKARPRRFKDMGLGRPELSSGVLYAEIPRQRIAVFRFLIEAYDNLAVMSVVDRYRAVIKLRFLPDAEATLRGLLLAEGAKIVETPGRSAV